MRDDLHKRAVIPPRAQSVLKLALRDADRHHPGRLRNRAREALMQLLISGLSGATLRMLSDGMAQGRLFGFAEAGVQAKSPVEARLFTELSLGKSASEGLESALKLAAASFNREVRATLVAGGVGNAAVILAAFSRAFEESAPDVAHEICSGSRLVKVTDPPIDLGENLLAPDKANAK